MLTNLESPIQSHRLQSYIYHHLSRQKLQLMKLVTEPGTDGPGID